MFEIKANLHIHTSYSDGSNYHAEIASEAIRAGLDVIFTTDHNIFIDELEGYFENEDGRVLLVMGEEIHNPDAFPQKNHLLSLGAGKSFAHLSHNRQHLIEKIESAGGVTILAHPYDPALPEFNEKNISWEDWSVVDYTGIELWNGFSEMKVRVKNKLTAFWFALFPKFLPLSPPQETLSIWNTLLNEGKNVVAVGGSDAHAILFKAGPLKRVIFPYSHHFSTINNHILLKEKLGTNVSESKISVLNAIQQGNLFLANDAIHSSNNFRFYIESGSDRIQMGENHPFKKGMVLSIILPKKAECRIIKNGNIYKKFIGEKDIQIKIKSPGIYRIECYKYFLGRRRGWIFSNPIYLQ
jgi:hypothetical protein